jgi:hypothetical protein
MSKKKVLAVAVALGAAVAAGSASAITITNTDGTNAFDGFDWAQGGTAYTVGFTGANGNLFTLNYFATATALTITPFNFTLPGMDIVANGVPGGPPATGNQYEYTIVASLQEQVDTCTTIGANTECTFNVIGGTFNIYYDTTPDSNAIAGALGTGFTDGTAPNGDPLISGTINPLNGQVFSTVTGSNSTTLQGVITFTSPLIDPALLGTTATTTLQIGQAITAWVNPGGFNGVAFAALQPSPADVVFQADANQTFTPRQVPEPVSLALLGLGLGAMGWSLRRKH